ncbi:hypothetical protein Senen10_00345 [Salmonella enterica subsp. enterica]|nr:Uncharacterised protein [Salmonella enterica subsp. enterica]
MCKLPVKTNYSFLEILYTICGDRYSKKYYSLGIRFLPFLNPSGLNFTVNLLVYSFRE